MPVHQLNKMSELEPTKLCIIDFFATWCQPCQVFAPKFKKLSDHYSNVLFFKVDVDEDETLPAKFKITAMPTFVFIKHNKEVGRVMGCDEKEFTDMLDKHM